MAKKKTPQKKAPPTHELYIMGEVDSWHVNMVAHHTETEVPQAQAHFRVEDANGAEVFKRRSVSDHLSLELEVVLRKPIRGFDRLVFSMAEWEPEEYGGISGELSYDKESGMRGNVHISGSFLRDLYAFLLSGRRAAFEIATKRGFFRGSAWVESLAFSDVEHPQWIEGESGLI